MGDKLVTCSLTAGADRERHAKRGRSQGDVRLHSIGTMTRILGLAAAVAWLAQASSALGIEVSQRTQGQALQAPVQFRAKSSPPEVDASLPRQEWKNKDTREKRAKERSVTKEKSAKRR